MFPVKWYYLFLLLWSNQYCNTQHAVQNKNNIISHCEGKARNAIIEQFYNVIFTEFHNTPPICVCVQMCAGQSTYCYPKGCFKPNEQKKVQAPQALSSGKVANRYMFVVDESSDNPEFVKAGHAVEEMDPMPENQPDINSYRRNAFVEKPNNFAKYKKSSPPREIKYSIRDQYRTFKTNIFSVGLSVTSTRWPNKSKMDRINTYKVRPYDKKAPFISKPKILKAILTDNNVQENRQYFKRDLQDREHDMEHRDTYLINNFENITDFSTFSLDTLLDNLIKTSIDKPDDATNDAANETTDESLRVIPLNKTTVNETSVFSIQNSKENTDKNKYIEYYEDPGKLNTMIKYLSHKIDKQNNTTIEMTKRMVSDFDIDVEDIGKTKVDFLRNINSNFSFYNSTLEESVYNTTNAPEKEKDIKTLNTEITETTPEISKVKEKGLINKCLMKC